MLGELLPEEKRKLSDLEQQFHELDKGSTNIQPSDISLGLKEMSSRLDEIERLIQKESKQKKDDFRRRFQHLKSTHTHIQELLNNYYKRHPYLYDKMQLFNGKTGNIHQNANSADDMALELAENGSLSRSSRMVSEYLGIGKDTLDDLVSQRERLKGVQRKAFDMMNYLGLSTTIIKNVEVRDFVDKWIVYIGMGFIIALILFIHYFWKK
jgi:Golgi SNAP receptor complex protein 2